MFSLMGNCISTFRGRRQPKKPVTLTLLGVDNAGKTTATYSFSGEAIDMDTAPTVGFRSVKFTFEKHDITLYDIGGGKKIRPVWKDYFPEVYGVIFIVDSSTAVRMEEVRETFRECLEHPHVSGKPVLLLANKQDKPDALDEVDICEMLNLETVVNSNKCPCRIDACSAVRGTGRNMDRGMKEGLRWLLSMVDDHWADLKVRVDFDMKVAEEARKVEAAARRERVRKQREEREKKEEEERRKLGIEKKNSDDEDMMEGDPFRPLDLNELKKKEETLKAEKKRYKELKASLKDQDPSPTALFTKPSHASHSPRGDTYKEAQPNGLEGERALTLGENGGERVFSPRARPSALPPLVSPLLVEEREERSSSNSKKKKKKKKRTPRGLESPADQQRPRDKTTENDDDDADDVVLATPRSQPVLTNSHTAEGSRTPGNSATTLSNIKVSTHDHFPARQMLAVGISRVPRPLDGGEEEGGDANTPRTRKVKKKRLRQLGLRHNGQVSGGDVELTPRPRSSLDGGDIDAKKKVWQNELGPTVEETGELSARRSGVPMRESNNNNAPLEKPQMKLSRNSQMHSNISIESDHMGSRTGSRSWGLAEDLPAVADDAIVHRRPNVIDDTDLVL